MACKECGTEDGTCPNCENCKEHCKCGESKEDGSTDESSGSTENSTDESSDSKESTT